MLSRSSANRSARGFAAKTGLLLLPLTIVLSLALCDDQETPNPITQGSGTWTVSGSTLTDPDGNTYTTVTIGTQTWTVENLKTTRYNDGTAVPLVSDKTAWSTLTTPGYCWYENDEAANKATYGVLYNWYAVNTGKLAPTGWRVPTKADLATLAVHLEGDSLAGGKMKETGTLRWQTPNTAATNSSGFSALPGGMRHEDGTFYYQREFGCWWTATEYTGSFAHGCDLGYNRASLNRSNYPKAYGHSVRLVRDN